MSAMSNTEDKKARLAMLQQLVEDLPADERRALSTFLSHKNDPLCILPLEIVIHIFSYLDILDVWRYQLVNQQWHLTLSSAQVTTPALNRWDSPSPAHGAPRRPSSSATVKARHIHALRFGSPFTAKTFKAPPPSLANDTTSQADRTFALSAHRIAYLCFNHGQRDRPHVVVQDLISGHHSKLYTTAREAIASIALTFTIVAFLNFHGKLYVSSLENPHLPTREIRLPSSSFAAFAADGDVCAVVFDPTSETSNYTVALYDHRIGLSKQITLPCATFQGDYVSPPHVVLLNSQRQTIDLFTSWSDPAWRDVRDISLEHRRHSLDGRELHTSRYHRQRVMVGEDFQFLHCDLHPTGENMYIFRQVMMCSTDPDNDASSSCFALCFDADKQAIEERHFPAEEVTYYSGDCTFDDIDYDSMHYDFTLWKDIAIRPFRSHLQFSKQNEDTKGTSLTTDTPRYTVTQPRLRLDSNIGHDLFVNDTFVVAVGEDPTSGLGNTSRCIEVFCFDEELECHDFHSSGYWTRRDGQLVRVPAPSHPEDDMSD